MIPFKKISLKYRQKELVQVSESVFGESKLNTNGMDVVWKKVYPCEVKFVILGFGKNSQKQIPKIIEKDLCENK